MRTPNLSAYVTTALLAVLTASVTGLSWDTDLPVDLLSDEEFENCGLQKLDENERMHLFRFLMAQPQRNFLAQTAEAWMTENGFKPTSITGPLPPVDGQSRAMVLAYRDGIAYTLEPPLIGDPLVPGTYWSDGIGSAWHVVLPNGDTDMYWVKEELQ